MDLTPIFRVEFFLDAIINSTTPPEPIFRKEFYLAKIAGADVPIPSPVFREEYYLAKICGEDVEIPEPIFRKEFWLAKKCGEDVTTPTPIFREEYWLEEWVNGSSPQYETITGRIVSFVTQRIAPLKIEATLTPKQSGSGDPSPNNVRPITGHTGADVYIEDEYDAQATPSVTITFGSTVYGGKLTVNEDGTGSVVAERICKTFTSCDSVGTASTGIPYANFNLVPADYAATEKLANNCISSEYKFRTNAPSDSGWFRATNNSIYIFDSRFTSKATADSILAEEQPQVCYLLATPITIPLTPGQVEALQGNNTVWVDDSDEIKVTYRSN